MLLTPEDHQRITAAVAKAEEGSSGDIFCVLAGEVSNYREVPIAWGAGAALIIPPTVAALFLGPLLRFASGGWTYQGAHGDVALALTAYAVAQACLFAAVALAVAWPPLRRRLTPRILKQHRVKSAAFHHFAAAHAHAQDSETGVLIFVALVERQVQVLADAGIHAEAGDAVWEAAAKAVQTGMRDPDPTAGIEAAIAICGEALKAHFPASGARVTDRPMDT
jgi:putative membrane protein